MVRAYNALETRTKREFASVSVFGPCFVMQYLVAIISLRTRELDALRKWSSSCCVAVSVLCLFLMVPWVGLQCVIVAFPGHTRL